MSPENKNRLALGMKGLLLSIWAMLTIATCSGVWSFCQVKAVKNLAVALFICNGAAIAILARMAYKKYIAVLDVLHPKHEFTQHV